LSCFLFYLGTDNPSFLMDASFLELEMLGLTVLAWLKLLGITAIISIALMIVKRVVFGRLSTLAERTTNHVDDVVAELLNGLRTFFLVIVSFYISATLIAEVEPDLPWLKRAVFLGVILQLGLSGSDLIRLSVGWYLKKKEGENTQVTAAKALALAGKMVLWLFIFLITLDNFGVDITALVAGLGIGGIAIALAVQNVLSDLLAYVSIVADQPFSYGEFLVVGEFSGTVEHIGIKTTRIRSLSGELIIFSNNDLLNSRVRNYKRMNERRQLFTIGVTYSTPYDRLKEIPDLLKLAVEEQEQVRFDRAHMKMYADFSINYEVVYYMLVPDYIELMNTQQAVNLRIHELFSERKIEFAFPTQTIHLAKAEA
jgi:small-conductance mechanosensitive channel